MEYLVNSEQKKLLDEMHKLNEQKAEKERKAKYNADNLFKNNKLNSNKSLENESIVPIKQPWYTQIKNFFKNIFNIKK